MPSEQGVQGVEVAGGARGVAAEEVVEPASAKAEQGDEPGKMIIFAIKRGQKDVFSNVPRLGVQVLMVLPT